jgi:hypothetical protein
MKDMQLNNSLDGEHPTFDERWVAGTYIVAGIFPSEGRSLTVERLIAQIPSFYALTRSHKRAMWPRGICGYYLIPIYVAESFDAGVIEWVRSYHPYRWAIWHVPVLYTSTANSVDKRAYGNSRSDKCSYGSYFWPYLESIIDRGLRAVSHRFGYELPETVNGKPVQKWANPGV